ncbi:alpha/beta hydrolase [Ottowia sp.]|jgi:arylformamidase|uniref:alpha/beta hydrolase n=1 Tax=Ottowia sp. TaxID=1898956 RepID=UPI0025E75691|nr:alpha/beta hydrolase [Ottowia sp.]MBK6612632.1 alpha/beta hydrolase [Ottowia sp.]
MDRPDPSLRHLPHRELPDTQWLERMYNNRMRVPDHGAYFARWAAESALARRSLPCTLDVAYGDGPQERLDAFAAPRAGAPVVVFVHGGYWKALDKSQHSFIAAALHDMGAAAVVPNYAFCPRLSIPQITLQVARAVAWAWRHAASLKGSARRITVIGHSAGGHAAAMMLACAWDAFDPALPPRMVRAAMGVSGLYDLEPLMHTPSLQEVLRLTPRQVHEASPARLPAPRHGRLVGVAGAQESGEYLRQNRLIQRAWGRERVPVAAALPGLNHFSIVDALARPGHRLNRMVQELLR